MSHTIGIRGVYKNGVAVNRGLHDSKNCDMKLFTLFVQEEMELLIRRFYDEVGDKKLNGDVIVHLNKSGDDPKNTRDIKLHIGLQDLHYYSRMFTLFFEDI